MQPLHAPTKTKTDFSTDTQRGRAVTKREKAVITTKGTKEKFEIRISQFEMSTLRVLRVLRGENNFSQAVKTFSQRNTRTRSL
jgi:hypothetical protein